MVLVPESNLAFEGLWMQQELYRSRARDICVVEEDDNRAGIRTNLVVKKAMTMALDGVLRENNVYMHRDFVCIGEANSVSDMQAEIVKQLLNYSRNVRPARHNKHAAVTETYGGKSGYGFDDHVIALSMNIIMKGRFFRNVERYGAWH